ncbi:MAG TPA: HDIG domain-containing metalloprotein [Chloroflexota bacterium]
MTRDEAYALLQEYVKGESLLKHMLAVEAAMRAYARKYGEDEERWGIAGLLHDFDWEIHPTLDQHPQDGAPILESRGVPGDIIRAILSHAHHTGVPRESLMEKALFACDELTGFIAACVYVRPSRSIFDLDARSVRKKMKDKAFARAVSREDIVQGAQELGVDLDEHIDFVIQAMRGVADELGLRGNVEG